MKMTWGQRYLLLFGLVLTFLVGVTVPEGETCSASKPDPTKTCISIRLPWQSKPMYFCVEKTKFKYRNQCTSRYTSNCGTVRNDTLMVATPWECCPLMSYPDSCTHHQCPPPPYERKCQTIPPNENQHWECCPTYFCEEDMVPEMCHYKLLDSSCNTPPEGKTNCISFIDNHGCCPKYQCDGDTREGLCPAEAKAQKYMEIYKTKNKTVAAIPGTHQASTLHDEVVAEMSNDAFDGVPGPHGGGMAMAKMAYGNYYPSPVIHVDYVACVGDFNCPGKMKCCSHDMYSYVSEGHYLQRNKNPTNGYCMEAAPKNETEKTT